MGRTICIASGKGGVGKTVITGNIGIALAQMGYRVCLVDADVAMANLSLLLGMPSSPITLHDVLLGEASVHDAIYDGPKGVNFIPSGLSLENYRRVDSERLVPIIDGISSKFDFIFLDAPAGIEKNVLSAISAADEIILVTTPDAPSIADALKTKIMAQRLNRRPLGIIVNMVRGEKEEISDIDIMQTLELPVYGIVPYDQAVRKAAGKEKSGPLIVSFPSSPAAVAIRKAAAKISGKTVDLVLEKKHGAIAGFFNKLLSIFRRQPKAVKIMQGAKK